jgi:hypothetical protein
MMWICYSLYGLKIASERVLPGIGASEKLEKADVIFLPGVVPQGLNLPKLQSQQPGFTSDFRDPQGKPLLQVWHDANGYHCFQYCEGFTFLIDRDGRQVWAQWSAPVTYEDVAAFFLSHILSYVLHLRGTICLHASAVAVEGQAVLFSGDSGAGKSSTAAAFAERGCRVLADDIAVVKQEPDGQLMVLPGFPRVCLWPDSAEFIYGAGSAGRYPRVEPREEKRLVRLDSFPEKYHAQAVPLCAIYLLAPRTAEESAPRIEPIEDAHRLTRLLTNGYVSRVLGREQRAREFHLLGEIARNARVRKLVPSSDPRKLGQLCELIVNDARAANTASLAGSSR